MYTLAGVANPAAGWGVEATRADARHAGAYGEAAWFGLGDRDLATHLLRTMWLSEG